MTTRGGMFLRISKYVLANILITRLSEQRAIPNITPRNSANTLA